MTSRLAKLALAATVAAAIPALAVAHDRERGHDHGRDVRPVVVTPPVYAPARPAAPVARHGWQGRELARVRAQLAALDAEHAEFHRLNGGRPGQLRRYDRRYLERRAVLERRERQLARVAWR